MTQLHCIRFGGMKFKLKMKCVTLCLVCVWLLSFLSASGQARPTQPEMMSRCEQKKNTHRMNIAELDNCKFEMSFSDLMKCIQTYHLTRLALYVANYNLKIQSKMMGFVNFFSTMNASLFLSLSIEFVASFLQFKALE